MPHDLRVHDADRGFFSESKPAIDVGAVRGDRPVRAPPRDALCAAREYCSRTFNVSKGCSAMCCANPAHIDAATISMAPPNIVVDAAGRVAGRDDAT